MSRRAEPLRHLVLSAALAAVIAGCSDGAPRYQQLRADADRTPAETAVPIAAVKPAPAPTAAGGDDWFAGVERLDGDTLLREVLRRSPAISARRFAFRAAVQRYPQATAWDDPTVSYTVAPRSIGNGDLGQIATVAQSLPWPGKRGAAGDGALALADAERAGIGGEEWHHVIETRMAFAEYWLARRDLALHHRTRELVLTLRDAAHAAAAAGGMTMEALDASMALSELDREIIKHQREQLSKAAAINALLGRHADAPLPEPVERLPDPKPLPGDAALRALSRRRPEVQRAGALLAAAEAQASLAGRAPYPDLRVVGTYSSMEDARNQLMLGLEVSVPIFQDRRDAAVDEARFTIAQRRAELAAAIAAAERDVMDAKARLDEGAKALELIRTQSLPIAEQAAAMARAGYAAGTATLAMVLRAERGVLTVRMMEAEELHEYYHQSGYLEDRIGLAPDAGTGKAEP